MTNALEEDKCGLPPIIWIIFVLSPIISVVLK